MSAEIIVIIGAAIAIISVNLTNMEAMCRRLESRLDVAATRENPKPSIKASDDPKPIAE